MPALGDAARRSRLDTYYAVSGFRRYIDDEFGFELRYPAEWLGDQSVYMARAERSAGVVDGDADAILKAQASRRRGPRPSAIAAFGFSRKKKTRVPFPSLSLEFEPLSLETPRPPDQNEFRSCRSEPEPTGRREERAERTSRPSTAASVHKNTKRRFFLLL